MGTGLKFIRPPPNPSCQFVWTFNGLPLCTLTDCHITLPWLFVSVCMNTVRRWVPVRCMVTLLVTGLHTATHWYTITMEVITRLQTTKSRAAVSSIEFSNKTGTLINVRDPFWWRCWR